MLKAAVRSPCRSGRAVCFHTANGVFLYPRRQIESTPQLLIQTLAHAEMVAAGGSSVAGEQDGGVTLTQISSSNWVARSPPPQSQIPLPNCRLRVATKPTGSRSTCRTRGEGAGGSSVTTYWARRG